MIERTRIARALAGIRGRTPVDQAALEQLVVTFSQMIIEQPAIAEVDINPLLASPRDLTALDARVVLHPAALADDQLPRPAIRPYPREYAGRWIGRDGAALSIRPIRPEDEPLLIGFHRLLSGETIYLRYLENLGLDQRVAHERLSRLCFIDYSREMALVAETRGDGGGGSQAIVAVARLVWTGDGAAEFALLVADSHQGRGLGTELLRRLLDIGRREGLRRIVGEIASRNGSMQAICRRLGFRLDGGPTDPTVQAVISL
jgi:acetyltransferase